MKSLSFLVIFCISIAFCTYTDTEFVLNAIDACHQAYHSCESGSKNVYCSCDWMCVYYDNCCFDAPAIKKGRKEMNDEDQHRQYLEMTTCGPVDFRDNVALTQGMFMISSCPVSWDNDVDTKRACELYTDTDVRDMLPVVDTSTNLTFKNRHCAKCHSVENYIPLLLEIECFPESHSPSLSVFEAIMTKLHSDRCSYRFLPPNDVTVRYCYQEFDYVITSNISEGDSNSTCRNRVLSPVVLEQGQKLRYFRTLQCLIVNEGPQYQKVLEDTLCVTYLLFKAHKIEGTISSLIDFSSLFRRGVTKCEDNEIRLSDKIGCRRLYCPARSEPSGGKCVDINNTSDGLILDLLFEVDRELIPGHNIYTYLSNTLSSFITDFENHTDSMLRYNDAMLHLVNPIPGIKLNSKEPCSVIHIYINVKRITLNGDTLESDRSWIANFFNNYTVRNKVGSVMRHIADVRNMSCKTNVSVRNPLYLQEMITVDNDLPCPAVKLHGGNKSDGEVQEKNASLSFFHLQGITVSPSDVAFANGDYFLCIDTFLSKYRVNYQQYHTLDNYRSYINTACSSLSIICMMYCLVQYFVIPIFRDGKSDLLIVLLLFLLLAQTCFFLFSHFEIPNNVCEWMGIVHHFAWLGAFVFMFLCPYRFNAEIRDLQTYSRSERMVITVKYVLVGISLPLFVIICTKTTNIILSPTEKWYGGRLCFISQTSVVLFGFVAPVILILCGNAFLFICIIRYISSTSTSTNSNKSNVIIFIKISTIMGFSWIIGIVAILSRSDVLLLIFEILSNLQGTFITVSFSCTNRIRAFYKDYFHRFKNQSSAQNTT